MIKRVADRQRDAEPGPQRTHQPDRESHNRNVESRTCLWKDGSFWKPKPRIDTNTSSSEKTEKKPQYATWTPSPAASSSMNFLTTANGTATAGWRACQRSNRSSARSQLEAGSFTAGSPVTLGNEPAPKADRGNAIRDGRARLDKHLEQQDGGTHRQSR